MNEANPKIMTLGEALKEARETRGLSRANVIALLSNELVSACHSAGEFGIVEYVEFSHLLQPTAISLIDYSLREYREYRDINQPIEVSSIKRNVPEPYIYSGYQNRDSSTVDEAVKIYKQCLLDYTTSKERSSLFISSKIIQPSTPTCDTDIGGLLTVLFKLLVFELESDKRNLGVLKGEGIVYADNLHDRLSAYVSRALASIELEYELWLVRCAATKSRKTNVIQYSYRSRIGRLFARNCRNSRRTRRLFFNQGFVSSIFHSWKGCLRFRVDQYIRPGAHIPRPSTP